MSRKVLLIAPQPFFSTRGTPINVRALVETISAAGHEVHLLVYPFGEPIEIPGVVIHRSWGIPGIREVPVGASWRKLLLDLPLSIAALLISLRHRFSAFHGIEEGGFVAGTLGILFHRPYIYDMDSCMMEQLRSGKFNRLGWVIAIVSRMERFFLRRAKAVLTVAAALTKKAELVAPQVPVFQIEDFPMDSANEIDPSLCNSLRTGALAGARKVMLYTGNFEYYQGVELALDAWKRAKEIYRGAFDENRLVLVGGTRAQIEALEQLSRKLGIDREVVFTGPRPPEEMGSFLAVADAVVSPRISGGNTPLKIFTYMASGKPIAATAISAHRSVLDSGTAFLEDPEPETFARAIYGALCDDSRDGRAKAAHELVSTRYSRKSFDEKLRLLYNFVLPAAGKLPAVEAEMSAP